MPVKPVSSLKLLPRMLLFVCMLSAWAGCAMAAEAPVNEPLARLLSKLPDEPLAVALLPDIRRLPATLSASAVGKVYQDQQYADGREAARKLLKDWAGADVFALWDAAVPQVTGPAVLAVAPAPDGSGALQVTLLLSAIDAPGAAALQEAAGSLRAAARSPLEGLRVLPLVAGELPAVSHAWAARLAGFGGFLRIELRPRALHAALAASEKHALPRWLDGLKNLADRDLERVSFESAADGPGFRDLARVEWAEGAAGTRVALAQGLRDNPKSWKGLMSALPGGQDVSLLVQSDFTALGEALPVGLQALERELRGKKWTRLHGDEEDAAAPGRFAFLTGPLSGSFGLCGSPTLTGEARIVVAAATRGAQPDDLRGTLAEKLALLGADFQAKDGAARIGEHAPLAAAFQGRGLFPAPVIGFSPGWLWLCSNTGAYGELVNAFAGARVLASDALPPPLFQAPAPPEGAPAAETPSALRLQVNLNSVLPLVYAAWLLSPEGPRIGAWKVPETLLPKNPALFNKRFGIFLAEAVREGRVLTAAARGPVPGGGLLPLALLAQCAEAVDDLKARRASVLRDRLKLIEELKTPAPAAPPEGKTP